MMSEGVVLPNGQMPNPGTLLPKQPPPLPSSTTPTLVPPPTAMSAAPTTTNTTTTMNTTTTAGVTAAATTATTAAVATTVQIGPTPSLSDTKRKNLEHYIERDLLFVSAFEQQKRAQVELVNEKQRDPKRLLQQGAGATPAATAAAGLELFGPGYRGLGNGTTGNAFHIVYPAHRRRPRRSKEFAFTKAMMDDQAQKDDVLVPIRLEVEVDGLVLRDTFTWNLHETLVTPEHFAEVLCEDMQLPPQQFGPHVSKAIREQIQDYHLPAIGSVDQEPESLETLSPDDPRPGQELRILIKIDITVANTSLVDQFEWDIACPNNDPEHFAEVLAAELGLGGEFRTAIAHSIREQVQTHTKCLNLIGYNYDGSSVHDEDLRSSFLPKILSILREEDAVEQFTPILEKLSEPEIDKLERDRERDKRRKRRQTRGRRGIILPDREPSKTKRTLLHHSHHLESADSIYDPLQSSVPQYDPNLQNRLGPMTRRTAQTHDYSSSGPAVTPSPSMGSAMGQGAPTHHRITRKLRGTGSDPSIHHLGSPAIVGHASMPRDLGHGLREKSLSGAVSGREPHLSGSLRETTPVHAGNKDVE